MKRSLKKFMFRIAAVIGMINILSIMIGLSFPFLCEVAQLFGAKVPGGNSAWASVSEWCFTTYTALSPLVLVIAWVSTVLGACWLVTNWRYFKTHYWESSEPVPQPQPERDEALEFRVW